MADKSKGMRLRYKRMKENKYARGEKDENPRIGNFLKINPYPTAFPYGNGMVLHFYQQQENSMTKAVHKVINKGLKAYV